MTTFLVAIFIILQLLDFLTTLKALKLGAKELNPIMLRFMNLVGTKPALIGAKLLAIIAVLIVSTITHSTIKLVILSALDALYSITCFFNLQTLRRLTHGHNR